MSKKVLIISSTPRKGGNSDKLCDAKGITMKTLIACAVMASTMTVIADVGANYEMNDVNKMLEAECVRRGITIVDYHVHLRGGMTAEKAADREMAWIVKSSAMDNHGREWETTSNDQLAAFAATARKVNPKMPVGIQVNDRDWFRQIDTATRAKFDYILADSMIMDTRPDGKANRLWEPQTIPDPEKWMDRYVEHNLQILGEPISIFANPTYLPIEIAGLYDRLWTEERMKKVIAKAVERGIAIEIQAESHYPRPKFLRLAKQMGAKFSFGTNNFTSQPKDLTHWLDAITWLDLKADDIWTPRCLKK